MEKEDYDEDYYEDSSNIVYWKRKSASTVDVKEDHDDESKREGHEIQAGTDAQRSREDNQESSTGTSQVKEELDVSQSPVSDIPQRSVSSETQYQSYKEMPKRVDSKPISDLAAKEYRMQDSRSKSDMRTPEKIEDETKDWSGRSKHTGHERPDMRASEKTKDEMRDWSSRGKQPAHERSDMRTSERIEDEMRDWSDRAKHTAHKRSDLPRHGRSYFAVTKWEVDYNNKNFIRSKLNKPHGLHRYIYGRPCEWEVDYDNTYYLRSKVNAPKGLHRRITEVKRKRVPDNDILGDSTGWEFEYGPEYDQIDGDVPFYQLERIIGRGGYRFYGVKRNNSDTDRKILDKHLEIDGLFEEEFKWGPEFLQDDVPHIIKQKEGRIGRGGYRFVDVDRSPCDTRPRDIIEVDYRASRASIDSDLFHEEKTIRKGKPFKRTVLKKTFKLIKPPSVEKFTHGTVISFTPGVGSKMFHQGKSTRPSFVETKKSPKIRNVFKSRNKTKSDRSRSNFKVRDDFTEKRTWDKTSPNRSNKAERFTVDDFRKTDYDQERQEFKKGRSHARPRGDNYSEYITNEERHRLPSEIQNKLKEIRGKMSSREIKVSDRKMKDWRDHEAHPFDTGKSITEGYEKFVNEKGSEIWVKTEQNYSEFHHKRL